MRWRRLAGSLVLSVILLATEGCRSLTTPTPSSALPRIEGLLTLKPLETECRTARGLTVPCKLVSERDWNAIVIELKAACLREGGTRERCYADR